MSDEFLVLGFLDDLEEGIRYAKLNDFGDEFVSKLQGFHDQLIVTSNRLEEEGDVSQMNEMIEDLVEVCFINCRDGNKKDAEKALGNLQGCLDKF